MVQTPAGTTRRDSLPFSETGSLGDDASPVVEFFREEVKEAPETAPPARSWLGGLGSYFKPARAPPPPPVDGYEDDSPVSRHDTPPLLMRHAPAAGDAPALVTPKAALAVQLSMRSTALAKALEDEDDESTASEASSATAEPVGSPVKRPASPFAAVSQIRSPAAVLAEALPNPPTPPSAAVDARPAGGDRRTGIASHPLFHPGTNQRRFRLKQRHRLALHVRTHERTVGVIVLKEWNQRSRDRHNLLRRNVHQLDVFWTSDLILTTRANCHQFVRKLALGVDRRICLSNLVPAFLHRRHIKDLFGHFAFLNLAIGGLDETVLIDP